LSVRFLNKPEYRVVAIALACFWVPHFLYIWLANHATLLERETTLIWTSLLLFVSTGIVAYKTALRLWRLVLLSFGGIATAAVLYLILTTDVVRGQVFGKVPPFLLMLAAVALTLIILTPAVTVGSIAGRLARRMRIGRDSA
jgi:hypothetical protein